MSEPGILPKPIPFGKYYLLERVNVGGMAEVYKAKVFGVEGFERLVAVKKILSSIAEDESFIKMFIDEAKIAVRLNHPNIAQIFELGKAAGSYFIAMEYISGKDLKTSFERARRIGEKVSVPRVCYMIMKVCEGLAHAHHKKDSQGQDLNIVHRDISPQNILISYEGEVKIIDFGIAKAQGKTSQTQVGILKGKFSYMSPEQVRGLHVDHRSDVFSLGIVMYELLTLERLFLGESDFDTLEKIRKVEMSPPSLYNPHIPKALEDIVLKALARTPEERYQSAYDLAEALEKFMRNQGYYYTNKDLAAYMKEAFQADIDFENKKLDYYRSLNLQPLTEDEQAPPPPQAPPQGGGLSWGEDEMETQIFDRAGGEDIGDSDIIYSEEIEPIDYAASGPASFDDPRLASEEAPTVEFERWDINSLDAMSFDDEAPDVELNRPQRRRPPQPTAQLTPVDRRRPQVTVQSPPVAAPAARKPWIAIAVALVVVALGVGGFFVAKPHLTADRRPTLEFDTHPGTVEILLNGDVIHTGETPFVYRTEPGSASIVVRSEGYEAYEETAQLEEGKTYTLNQRLRPAATEKTGFMVKTTPEGARVEFDGKTAEGTTPVTVRSLKPGTYRLKITHDEYFEEERDVTVKRDEIATLEVALRPRKVALSVNSSPERAEYTVFSQKDNKKVASGRTPDTVKDLDASQAYKVVVERRGYDTWEKSFEPGAEASSTLNAELNRQERAAPDPSPAVATTEPRNSGSRASNGSGASTKTETNKGTETTAERPREKKEEAVGTGTLSIASRPVARVYINDKDTGRYTPLIDFKIKAGKHKIGLVNPEFGLNKTYYVDVEPGESKRIINR